MLKSTNVEDNLSKIMPMFYERDAAKDYWKQLKNKQEMKDSRLMKWNNYIN
jgi:hypothetical protein